MAVGKIVSSLRYANKHINGGGGAVMRARLALPAGPMGRSC